VVKNISLLRRRYTFAYVRGPDGKLKIVLHHSSVPYNPGH